jgi:leucine-rich repeat-containing protein 49
VISNRPGVAVTGTTPGQASIPDVGVYGSAANLAPGGGIKINVDSKSNFKPFNNLELAASEEDERYRYLLKNGIVRRVEDEDKIIFAELPQIPGVLVVYRKPSERNANPDRLNLDKRDLTHMPLLEGEERLRLLNLQHNHVQKIENLVSLPALIFLDLYNNNIKEISHLHTVPTLRVLMLGKNYIERIRNL